MFSVKDAEMGSDGAFVFFWVIHQHRSHQRCLATKSALAPGCPNPPSAGPQETLGLRVGWYSVQGTEEGPESASSQHRELRSLLSLSVVLAPLALPGCQVSHEVTQGRECCGSQALCSLLPALCLHTSLGGVPVSLQQETGGPALSINGLHGCTSSAAGVNPLPSRRLLGQHVHLAFSLQLCGIA